MALDLTDLTANGNDLVNVGADEEMLNIPSGLTGSTACAKFVQANSDLAYITDGNQTGLDFSTTFTGEAWIYINSFTGANQALIAKDDDNANSTRSYVLNLDNTGRLYAVVLNGTGQQDVYYYDGISLQTWTHFAVTCDVSNPSATTFEFFINGSSVGNGTSVATDNISAINDSTTNFSLGAKYNSGTPKIHADVLLEDVRMWNDVRTPGEISTNYNVLLTGSETGLEGNWQMKAKVASGYDYKRTITVDNTKVSGSADHTNFPVAVAGTYTYLKDTGNGGKVEDSNGYDIEFSSDSDGDVKLSHEIEQYVDTSGRVCFWVRIPTLDYNNDTTFYMWYANSSVSTSQEDANGVWDSDYVAVYHMNNSVDGTADELKDSTSNAFHGTRVGTNRTPENGSIGLRLDLGGSTTISIPDDLSALANDFTIDAVSYASANPSNHGLLELGVNGSNGSVNLINAAGTLYSRYNDNDLQLTGGTGVTNAIEYWVSYRNDTGGACELRQEKSSVDTNTYTTDLSGLASGGYLGRYEGGGTPKIWPYKIEMARFSKNVRGNDYTDTVYDNYNSPSTFYAVGSEQPTVVTGTHIFGDEGLVA